MDGTPYQHVAVLLIKWADNLEEVKTRDQANELESLFKNRFHYETNIVELDIAGATQPNTQLSEHLSSFIRIHDGPNNLLIIYYSGFGVLRRDDEFLELSAISKPAEKDILASWEAAEIALRRPGINSDIWVTLTTPFSPKLPPPDHHSSLRRSYELLIECPERTLKFSEPRSFNRAAIRSFNVLLDEMPNIPFTTEHLHSLILLDPTRKHMQVELRSQLHSEVRQAVFLVAPLVSNIPVSRQVIDTEAVNRVWNSTLHRNDLILRAAMADDKWGERLDIESITPNEEEPPSSNQHMLDEYAFEVARALWHDWCLYSLYRKLAGKIGRKRFVHIHDHILMKFLQVKCELYWKRDLGFQRRSLRTRISEIIYELYNSPLDPNPQPSLVEILALKRGGKYKEDYPELKALAQGPSFQTLWDDLISNFTPYLSIQSALHSGNVDILRILITRNFQNALSLGNINALRVILAEYFDIIAVGELSWIKELDDAGYTREDIANLLYEEAFDDAWIFFEPELLYQDPTLPDEKLHIHGCVHQVLEDPHGYSPIFSPLNDKDDDVKYQVQELCGIAGITPCSRSKENWSGSVSFARQGTVAEVSYAVPGQNVVYNRVITTLERLCSAASRAQSSGYCCNTFTALIHNKSLMRDAGQIKVYRIQLRDAVLFLEAMKACDVKYVFRFGNRIFQTPSSYKEVTETALQILSPFGFQMDGEWTIRKSLQVLSLAAQFLSLSFLSYNQGHVGPIRPFFLDTALSTIHLSGIGTQQPWQLEVTSAELTCVGDMLASPILVFSVRQGKGSRNGITGQKFDLLTTAENFLDTWGPGNFILRQSNDRLPCAIQIGGGIVCGYDSTSRKFHWTKRTRLEGSQPICFDPRSEILIGGLVSINSRCQIDEKECWNKSCSAFENLGVHGDFWIHDEKQIGGQAGQYVMVQHNRIKHKVPGKTLKQYYLHQDPETLMGVLNCFWGLQVSFCTGVTRRVPLRLLIADLFPYFSKLFPNGRALWEELQDKHDILNKFRTADVQGWFATLPPQLYEHVLQAITRILLTLQPTGIDQEGKSLLVAWPYDCPPFRCFKVPCHDKTSSWARVLADSEDCATFAYISTTCLETPSIGCRGPSPLWQNRTPLLETAVVRHNETPSIPLGPLEHKNSYFLKKLNSLLQVTVERQACGPVSLIVSTSIIPDRFWQRVYAMEMKKNQRSRIRERQKQDEIGSENVVVLTKLEGTTLSN